MTFTGPRFFALWPVLALRTTVTVETRAALPKTSSQSVMAAPSSLSSISRKSAPSAASRGTVARRRSRRNARHSAGLLASSYSANVRPVLNGGSM